MTKHELESSGVQEVFNYKHKYTTEQLARERENRCVSGASTAQTIRAVTTTLTENVLSREKETTIRTITDNVHDNRLL